MTKQKWEKRGPTIWRKDICLQYKRWNEKHHFTTSTQDNSNFSPSVLVHSASENSTLLIFRVLNIFEQLSKWISQVIDYSLFYKENQYIKNEAKECVSLKIFKLSSRWWLLRISQESIKVLKLSTNNIFKIHILLYSPNLWKKTWDINSKPRCLTSGSLQSSGDKCSLDNQAFSGVAQ